VPASACADSRGVCDGATPRRPTPLRGLRVLQEPEDETSESIALQAGAAALAPRGALSSLDQLLSIFGNTATDSMREFSCVDMASSFSVRPKPWFSFIALCSAPAA